ncbi:STAS domain-containing protein [Ramlibacter henchirensis]|uniref:STAS domain-containing protein n=1 Tax=Ramlibacter henchirensis TaxID=204072 RepID=A0A4Z0C4B3_9BURK|nr:STAS domain-containing protein [Ramlibacter henchirensis]TFZ05278.1 STAS domain-containing protein [Ramlibacter henchirensis]
MPKDESSGILSKVVKFVRNPASSWSEGAPDSEQESNYSKQMLKEMIERKRRNDFVRKREFDMLRKMRRSEVMAGQDPAARPSFFQSSMPSKPDDRASTLKKIDEIEAQMSMQWWKTKHGAEAVRTGSSAFPTSSVPPESSRAPVATEHGGVPRPQPAPVRPAAAPAALNHFQQRTEPMPLATPAPAQPKAAPPVLDALEWDVPAAAPPAARAPSVVPAAAVRAPVKPPAPAAARPVAAPGTGAPAESVPPSGGFSSSKLAAVDVEEFAHDPELEEAAIRFANGDDAGAEAGLMEVLRPGGSRIDHDETWLTLFDLYRATGQQDRFESVAIEFAGRFGRSAPQWISLPEAVGRMGAAASPASGGAFSADWTCPSSLGTQTLAALNAALARFPQPWRLSWTKLVTIEEPALEGLTRLFTQWATQPVQLRFIGAENLENLLRAATPSGDKGVNPAWWRLRMEVLRVMHRPDEFELVALDYCVTYEVSPPSWESARCDYKPLQADGSAVAGHTIIGEAFRDSLSSNIGFGDTQAAGLSSQMAQVATVELAGQILGDAKDAIDMLDSKLVGADIMVISCARLIRIDFTAAGTLLNWVSARQHEGRQVQFVEVHRLVAAFYNVIGISEHSRVIARRD